MDQFMRVAMRRKYSAIEFLVPGALGRITQGVAPDPGAPGAHDRAPGGDGMDTGAAAGSEHGHSPSVPVEVDNISTSCSIRWVRPIQAAGRIALTQSAKDGMKPRSSRMCCSPTHRVGMTRPVESLMVGPKIVPP